MHAQMKGTRYYLESVLHLQQFNSTIIKTMELCYLLYFPMFCCFLNFFKVFCKLNYFVECGNGYGAFD